MTEFRFPRKGERTNHSRFYGDKEIEGWRTQLALRSELTANDYVRRLAFFCRSTGWSPAKLVSVAKGKDGVRRMEAFLTEYATAMKATGRRDVYIRKHLDAIKSWLSRNGVKDFRGIPQVSGRRGETLENEQTPTPEELRRLLAGLDLRGRVSALLMSHSGLRPGAIGAGSDGLRLGDLPELDIEKLAFAHVPFVISVRAARSKNARRYVTFGSPSLGEGIVASLRDRVAKGETPTAESPVVASTEGGGFLTQKAIVKPIRRAIRVVRPGGRTFRPYALRAYFSTQLHIAESRGAVIRDAREEMLGHDLGVSGRYGLAKKLNPEVLEELRGMYERSLSFISEVATAPVTSNEDFLRLVARRVLKLDAKQVEELGPLSIGRLDELLEAKDRSEAEVGDEAKPGSQKVIEASAVETYIGKGWRYVAPLNGTKAIVEAPAA